MGRFAPIIATLASCFLSIGCLTQPQPASADSDRSPYALIFCYNEAEQYLTRAFALEGCRDGYRQLSRDQWLERAHREGGLPPAQYRYFKQHRPQPLPPNAVVKSFGTSFAINDTGHLATSHHVVAACEQVMILTELDLVPAEIVTAAASRDLALLQSPYRAQGLARLRHQPLVLGEPVYAFGFPLLTKLRSFNMTSGIVSGVQVMAAPNVVQLSTPLQPGNSGGPVVDEQGLVGGVVAARLRDGQSVGFGVQGKVLRQLLDEQGIAHTVASPGETVDTEILAQQARRYTLPLLCLVTETG